MLTNMERAFDERPEVAELEPELLDVLVVGRPIAAD